MHRHGLLPRRPIAITATTRLFGSAEKFIRGGQWDEKRGKDKSDPAYGGVGYGAKSKPDLSNTAFLIDALKAAGNGPDDEAMQAGPGLRLALPEPRKRAQHHAQFAAKVNDGGFYYNPTLGKQDEDRQTANGGLRSYGSMTYSGLKSMIYAGLTKDDPRVKAAVQWIRKNYDVKSNPGLGDAGLFYYYLTFAKTLDALGLDEIEDAKGVKHDWRRELTEELARRQKKTAPGSTPTTAGWKATPTWPPPSVCWPFPIAGRTSGQIAWWRLSVCSDCSGERDRKGILGLGCAKALGLPQERRAAM